MNWRQPEYSYILQRLWSLNFLNSNNRYITFTMQADPRRPQQQDIFDLQECICPVTPSYTYRPFPNCIHIALTSLQVKSSKLLLVPRGVPLLPHCCSLCNRLLPRLPLIKCPDSLRSLWAWYTVANFFALVTSYDCFREASSSQAWLLWR